MGYFLKRLSHRSVSRISTDSNGIEANRASYHPSFSSDGRYVAFSSSSDNLVADDTNEWQDVFLKDLQTGLLTRVSTSPSGSQLSFASAIAAVSRNATSVAFTSAANAVGDNVRNFAVSVFVKQIASGEVTLVSAAFGGANPKLGNAASTNLTTVHSTVSEARVARTMSTDGRYSAFVSLATNLNKAEYNNYYEVFLSDSVTGEVRLVSANADGIPANAASSSPSVSGDGRYVSFTSTATNLVPNHTDTLPDIFVKDMVTGQVTHVSTLRGNPQLTRDAAFYSSSISADGRHIAFSYVTQSNDFGNLYEHVYVRNLQLGTLQVVSATEYGNIPNSTSRHPSISDDGRFIAFESNSGGLVLGDTNSTTDVFVKDMQTGAIVRASLDSFGNQANGSSTFASLSGDGRYVAFRSAATNLAPGITRVVTTFFYGLADRDHSPSF